MGKEGNVDIKNEHISLIKKKLFDKILFFYINLIKRN